MMHTIGTYESVRADADGEILLSADADRKNLKHANGTMLFARIEGDDIVVQSQTPFRFRKAPKEVIEYFEEKGLMRFAEFGDNGIDRLASLMLARSRAA